jgi:N-acetyl-gamma-glutamyl-phosphate reductase
MMKTIDAGIVHGSGYVGRELIRLLIQHPAVRLAHVSSRTHAGKSISDVYPEFRGVTELGLSEPRYDGLSELDALFVAGAHGDSVGIVDAILRAGYEGLLIDLSADFRLRDPSLYPEWYNFAHPAPDLLSQFAYGLPELNAPYPSDCRMVANPGCFATGITLALWPLAQGLDRLDAFVTAVTGASGSGVTPSVTTHFPDRDGNVRAYRVLRHRHLPEVLQALGKNALVSFAPVSGPFTRGIWGTAHIPAATLSGADMAALFESAYRAAPFVRLWPGRLPELRWAVGSPYCDIGWIEGGAGGAVIGFALDNLLKGAASQAVQNLNLLAGLAETTGLLPGSDD